MFVIFGKEIKQSPLQLSRVLFVYSFFATLVNTNLPLVSRTVKTVFSIPLLNFELSFQIPLEIF